MSKNEIMIDINSDVGERPIALADGTEEKLIQYISSANIACGGHAGDVDTMEQTIRLAAKYQVCVGAHPGYPDRQNFGRIKMSLTLEEITGQVYQQVHSLAQICNKLKVALIHVKPHGALYNVAVKEPAIAAAIARGVAKWNRDLILVGLANSRMIEVWLEAGFRVAREGFVDRAYEPDGTLRPRTFADSLLHSPEMAASRALQMAQDGSVSAIDGTKLWPKPETLCIHSDTPNSHLIAKAVVEIFRNAGVAVGSLDGKRKLFQI